jgi:hypothetical protein
VSNQSADDLVEGLGLAGLVVEPGAATDQGTADDGEPGWRRNAYLLQLGFSPVRRRAAGDRRATCAQR